MSDPRRYNAIVIGSGKGGKTLAMSLGKQNCKKITPLTSDTIQRLDAVPTQLPVLGAGYIDLEFAQMMQSQECLQRSCVTPCSRIRQWSRALALYLRISKSRGSQSVSDFTLTLRDLN
jgi:hypothetical protein